MKKQVLVAFVSSCPFLCFGQIPDTSPIIKDPGFGTTTSLVEELRNSNITMKGLLDRYEQQPQEPLINPAFDRRVFDYRSRWKLKWEYEFLKRLRKKADVEILWTDDNVIF